MFLSRTKRGSSRKVRTCSDRKGQDWTGLDHWGIGRLTAAAWTVQKRSLRCSGSRQFWRFETKKGKTGNILAFFGLECEDKEEEVDETWRNQFVIPSHNARDASCPIGFTQDLLTIRADRDVTQGFLWISIFSMEWEVFMNIFVSWKGCETVKPKQGVGMQRSSLQQLAWKSRSNPLATPRHFMDSLRQMCIGPYPVENVRNLWNHVKPLIFSHVRSCYGLGRYITMAATRCSRDIRTWSIRCV